MAAEPEVTIVPARYRGLRTIIGVFRVLGWMVIVGGTLLSLGIGSATAPTGDPNGIVVGVLAFISGTLGSVVAGVLLLALGNLMGLLVDIERNTRAAALNLAEID